MCISVCSSFIFIPPSATVVDAQFFEAPSGRGVDSRQHLWSGFFSRFVVYCIGIAVCLLQQALRLRKSVSLQVSLLQKPCRHWAPGLEPEPAPWAEGPDLGLWNFCRVWIRFRTFLLLIFKRGWLSAGADSLWCMNSLLCLRSCGCFSVESLRCYPQSADLAIPRFWNLWRTLDSSKTPCQRWTSTNHQKTHQKHPVYMSYIIASAHQTHRVHCNKLLVDLQHWGMLCQSWQEGGDHPACH